MFEWEVTGHYKGVYYPMILVQAWQPENPYAYAGLGGLVYGALDRPSPPDATSGVYTTTLGAGSSAWSQNGGGAARCRATLHLYPGMHSDPILEIAHVDFEAAG